MFANAALLLALCCGPAEAVTESTSGFASSDNFVVYAPTQELADEVLKKSEQLRTKLARAWLDKELAPGVGAAMIHIILSQKEDRGFTWPKDHPAKRYHSVTIKSSREKALGVTLAHELTHVILATEFQNKLPRWADEGAASFQDESSLQRRRRETLMEFAHSGQWPSLENVLGQEGVSTEEHRFFTVANSLTEFLLEKGEPRVFFQFSVDGREKGWEFAARKHYEFRSLKELEARWREWSAKTSRRSDPKTLTIGRSDSPRTDR